MHGIFHTGHSSVKIDVTVRNIHKFLHNQRIKRKMSICVTFRKSINDHLLFNSILHRNKSEIQYYNLLMINTVMFFCFHIEKIKLGPKAVVVSQLLLVKKY